MKSYYRKRAGEYESIYFRPDPQRLLEQEEIARSIRTTMKDRSTPR